MADAFRQVTDCLLPWGVPRSQVCKAGVTNERKIWLTRHGESQFNTKGLIGGDSLLSERGERCAGSRNALLRNHDACSMLRLALALRPRGLSAPKRMQTGLLAAYREGAARASV